MRSTDSTSWHPASWQTRKAAQQPSYDDPTALGRVVAELARLPPIVVSSRKSPNLRSSAVQTFSMTHASPPSSA